MKRRILVLQLYRLGDVLMTTPLLRGLRREHPGSEITLVLLDAFAGVPLPAALYDRLVPFPLTGLSDLLDDGRRPWTEALERLRAFLADIGTESFDLAINLSHTDISALLMCLIPSQDRRGMVMGCDRRAMPQGDWTKYLRAVHRSRSVPSIHLADLYARIGGVACDGKGLDIVVDAAAERWARAWLETRGITTQRPVALQLGASEDTKRWPAERFAAAIDLLPEATGPVVLVGTAAERDLAGRFLAASRRGALDAVGATSLPQLAALLERCRLLITNDTGTMHVATAVGTRVVDVSSGPVSVHETGPFGADHLSLVPEIACHPCPVGTECCHHACHDGVQPIELADAVQFALGNAPAPTAANARVLLSREGPLAQVEFGPADPARTTWTDRLRRALALMWDQTLGPSPRDGRSSRFRCTDGNLTVAAHCTEWTLAARELATAAKEADAAAALVRRLVRAPAHQRGDLVARAHGHLQRLVALAEHSAACQPVIEFLRLELEGVPITDLRTAARGQEAAYVAAARRARLLACLLDAGAAFRAAPPDGLMRPAGISLAASAV